MSLQSDRAIRDREIIESLTGDPALLAIVDALYCTQHTSERRRRRTWPPLAAAAVAVAATLGVWAPWGSGPGLVPRALAAVGDQPVLHVVVEQPLAGRSVLDLRTGALTSATTRTEILYDESGKVKRIVTTSPLSRPSDELQTATGDWIDGSPVYTCAWIAAHPAAASAARVSCPAGSSPRPQPPTIDPALAAFATGYQAALRSGKARGLGDGTVGSRKVHWLAVGADERVAIDSHTLLPVLVRATRNETTTSYRVLSFGTEPFAASSFARGKQSARPLPAGQSVHGSRQVDLADARRALGGSVLVPRPALGLHLSTIRLYRLLTGYDHARPARHSTETVLAYTSGSRSVSLFESRMPDMVAGFAPASTPVAGAALLERGPSLPPGAIDRARLARSGLASAPWQAMTKIGDIYVTVSASSKPLLLKTVRTLVPNTQ